MGYLSPSPLLSLAQECGQNHSPYRLCAAGDGGDGAWVKAARVKALWLLLEAFGDASRASGNDPGWAWEEHAAAAAAAAARVPRARAPGATADAVRRRSGPGVVPPRSDPVPRVGGGRGVGRLPPLAGRVRFHLPNGHSRSPHGGAVNSAVEDHFGCCTFVEFLGSKFREMTPFPEI